METNYTKRLKLFWPVFALFMFSTFFVNAQITPLSSTQVNQNLILTPGSEFCATETVKLLGTLFTNSSLTGTKTMNLVFAPSVTSATATVKWQYTTGDPTVATNFVDVPAGAFGVAGGTIQMVDAATGTQPTGVNGTTVNVVVAGFYHLQVTNISGTLHLRRVVEVVTNDQSANANNVTSYVTLLHTGLVMPTNNTIGPVLNACNSASEIRILGSNAVAPTPWAYEWYRGATKLPYTTASINVPSGGWAVGDIFTRKVVGTCVAENEATVMVTDPQIPDIYIAGFQQICLLQGSGYQTLAVYEVRRVDTDEALLGSAGGFTFAWRWANAYGVPQSGTSTSGNSFGVVWNEETEEFGDAWVEVTVMKDGCTVTELLPVGISKQVFAVAMDDFKVCGTVADLEATVPTDVKYFKGQWTKHAGVGPVVFDPPYSSTDDSQGKVYDSKDDEPEGDLVEVSEIPVEGAYTFWWSIWSEYCPIDREPVVVNFYTDPEIEDLDGPEVVCVDEWDPTSESACGSGRLTADNEFNRAHLTASIEGMPIGGKINFKWRQKSTGVGGAVFFNGTSYVTEYTGSIDPFDGTTDIETYVRVCALGTYTIELEVWNDAHPACSDKAEIKVTFEQRYVVEVKDPNRPALPATMWNASTGTKGNFVSPYTDKAGWVPSYADAIADNTYPLKARAWKIAKNQTGMPSSGYVAETNGQWRTILKPDGSNMPVFNNRNNQETNVTVSSYGKYAFMWTADRDDVTPRAIYGECALCADQRYLEGSYDYNGGLLDHFSDYGCCDECTNYWAWGENPEWHCPTCQFGGIVFVEFFPRLDVTAEADFNTCSLIVDLNAKAVRVPKVANMSGTSKYDINTRVWEVTHYKNTETGGVEVVYDPTKATHPVVRFNTNLNAAEPGKWKARNLGVNAGQTYDGLNNGDFDKVWVRIGDNNEDWMAYGTYTFRTYARISSSTWHNLPSYVKGGAFDPYHGFHIDKFYWGVDGTPTETNEIKLPKKGPFVKADPHTTYEVGWDSYCDSKTDSENCWNAYYADQDEVKVSFYWKPVATVLTDPAIETCVKTINLDAVKPPNYNPPYVNATGKWTVVPAEGVVIADPDAHETTATFTKQGDYKFIWTVTNPIGGVDVDPTRGVPCLQATSEVNVRFYESPADPADAGIDEYGIRYCLTQDDPRATNFDGNLIQLNAKWTVLDPTYRSGWWEYETDGDGTVTFYAPGYDFTKAIGKRGTVDNTVPNAVAVFDAPGNYTITWYEKNGPCAITSESFSFVVYPSPEPVDLFEIVANGKQVEPQPVCPGDIVHYVVEPDPTDFAYIRWIIPAGSNGVIYDVGGLDNLGRSSEPWVKIQWGSVENPGVEADNRIEFELIEKTRGCITYQKPAYIEYKDYLPAETIVGATRVKAGSTESYEVTYKPGVTYIWSIVGGSLAQAYPANANKVNVVWGDTPTGSVSVTRLAPGYCDVQPIPKLDVVKVKGELAGVIRYFNPAETAMPSPFWTTFQGNQRLQDHFYVELHEVLTGGSTQRVGQPFAVERKDGTGILSYFEFKNIDLNKNYKLRVYDGSYNYIPNIAAADRQLAYSYTWNNWGGVSSVDIQAIMLMDLGQDLNGAPFNWKHVAPLTDTPHFGFFSSQIADINSSGTITEVDPLLLLTRVLNPSVRWQGMTPNFRVAGRMVETLGEVTFPDYFSAANADDIKFDINDVAYIGTYEAKDFFYESEVLNLGEKTNLNIYYVAVGDVNSDYVPLVEAAKSDAAAVALNYTDVTEASNVGDIVEIPVRISNNAEVGVHTIGLAFNNKLIEVLGVNYELSHIDNAQGILRVGSLESASFRANDEVMVITARVLGELRNAQLFTVEPITEFASLDARALEVSLNTNLVSVNAVTGVIDANVVNLSTRNFPNPFNTTTTIEYTLPEAGKVSLVVYNNVGQVVTTLVDEVQNAGTQQVVLSRSELSGDGMFIYRITVEGQSSTYTATGNVILMK